MLPIKAKIAIPMHFHDMTLTISVGQELAGIDFDN